MNWAADTVPGPDRDLQMDQSHPLPMALLAPALNGGATFAPSMGLTLDSNYYDLDAQQAHFDLLTSSAFPVPQSLQTAPIGAPSGESFFSLAAGLPHEQSESPFDFQYHLHHASQIAGVAASHSTLSPVDTVPPISAPSVASSISPIFTAEGSPCSTTHGSPVLTAGNSSVASWTPSPPPALLPPPRCKKKLPSNIPSNASATTMSRTEDCDGKKKPNPVKCGRSGAGAKVCKKSRDAGGRPKGPLNPSNFDTLEQYQTELRLWHNRIGRKYRTKLNDQFECLHVVLYPDEEDLNDAAPDRGRTINKARTLDMARQRILDLTHENNALRAELEEMQGLMSEK